VFIECERSGPVRALSTHLCVLESLEKKRNSTKALWNCEWYRNLEFEFSGDFVGRFSGTQAFSPVPARMENIPSGPFHVAPSSSGIVISESINKRVP
jgi:hypothetical protein